jgi:hypothetical protein
MQRATRRVALDGAFFVFGGVSAIWLAYLLLRESFSLGWGEIWFSFLWWVLLAYLVLPRLQRILTRIYVPNYFIGRARTSDGLLGDPVNLALLGSDAQVHAAMTAAGWNRANDLTLSTGWRIVRDTLARRSYPEAPVSPLLLFDRRQDFAYQQQVGSSPGSRHHVRFWQCPPGWKLPGGRAVDWVASGSFDRSVGLSLFTLQVTHRIASDTDAERDHIVQSISAANPAARVSVIEDFSAGYHARNGGGDSIVTDGNLPIVDVGGLVVSGTAGATQQSAASGTTRRSETPPALTPTPPRRSAPPAPIVVGTVLLLARAAVSLYLVATLLMSWDTATRELLRRTTLTDQESTGVALGVVVAGIAAFALAEGVIAWRLFRGHNHARVLAMGLSSVVIVVQALSLATGGSALTLESTLSGLSLDVLLVLALSSDRARQFTLRRVSERRRQTSDRRGPR